MMSLNLPTPLPGSSGCAVLIEPGSGWPERAFESSADRDRVVVLHVSNSEDSSRLLHRIRKHCDEFERCGAKLSCIILACSGADQSSLARRPELVRTLIPLLDHTDGKIVLESDPSAGLSTHDLLASVGSVLVELNGRSLSFVGNDEEIASEVRARPPSRYPDERDADCLQESHCATAK